jgi:tRNA (uracil-5-)-methyltransferase TRM9
MQPAVIRQLIELNRNFYHRLGEQFSATRQRLQPGVRLVLETIPEQAGILDLGCGNGELARSLIQAGFLGVYLGVDFSPVLIGQARRAAPESDRVLFRLLDITDRNWVSQVIAEPGSQEFDFVFAFAVLHHLPGAALRLNLMQEIHDLLKPGGVFIHSVWQFMNSERLRARIQPWLSIGLEDSQVDPGDTLLDWRSGGAGLRYVHHFDPEELNTLAQSANFAILQTFASDGEGGRLSLYQKWVAK